MMEFKEFSKEILRVVVEMLTQEGYAVSESYLDEIVKPNSKRLALVLKEEAINIAASIYLDVAYDNYANGRLSFDECVFEIIDTFKEQRPTQDFDVASMQNFDYCRDKIIAQLISTKLNKELLLRLPHVDIVEGIAMTFAINLEADAAISVTRPDMVGVASINVTNSLLDDWNISLEELKDIAMANVEETTEVESMMDMLKNMGYPVEIFADAPIPNMMIVSNKSKVKGAVNVLTKRACEALEVSFNVDKVIIVPSSIHECIALPFNETMDALELANTISYVNNNELRPELILSDLPYVLDLNTREISLLDMAVIK